MSEPADQRAVGQRHPAKPKHACQGGPNGPAQNAHEDPDDSRDHNGNLQLLAMLQVQIGRPGQLATLQEQHGPRNTPVDKIGPERPSQPPFLQVSRLDLRPNRDPAGPVTNPIPKLDILDLRPRIAILDRKSVV